MNDMSVDKIDLVKFHNKGFEIQTLEDFYRNSKNSFLGENMRSDFYNLIYVTKGTTRHELDFVKYTLRSGDMLFISDNRSHKYLELDGAKGYIIMFTEGFLCEFLSHNFDYTKTLYRESYLTPHIKRIELYEELIVNLLETINYTYNNLSSDFTYEIIASSFKTISITVVNMIKESHELKLSQNPIFTEFRKLVDEHLACHKTVEAYAKMMHVSKKTINQLTRRAIDVSAKQYIINQIILKIKISLCFEDTSINEIAEKLGFSEPSNMSNFFKKYVSKSPKEFRKENRRGDEWFNSQQEHTAISKNLVEQRVYNIKNSDIVPMHTHNFYDEIFYCIKGSGIGILEDKEISFRAGETFIAKAGKSHSLKTEEDLYVLSILLPVRTT